MPQAPNPEMAEIKRLLEEQNELLRRQMGMSAQPDNKESEQCKAADKFIEQNNKEMQVIRSVTSQSFKRIYRPIESGSAKQIGLIGGLGRAPKAIVDRDVLGRIEADSVDDATVIVMAVVNSFSRNSKTGIVFSRDYMASFRIEYSVQGRLPREDDFSWSQYSGKPIKMTGRFVRFFDGKVKKFLVYHVERVLHKPDIDDYFNSDRPVRPL